MRFMIVFELMYLTAAAVLSVFLAYKFKELETVGVVLLCIAIGLCAFMYSFRRKQRKQAEERERNQGKGGQP